MPKTDQELQGLRGWLILLAIGLIGMPGNLISYTQKISEQFHQPGIAAFITAGTSTYDPRWQMLFIVETSAHDLALIPAILLIFLFIFKHRSFPIVFSTFAGYLMVLTITKYYLIVSTPTLTRNYQSPILAQTSMSLIMFSIWIAYIFRSRRVRLTFTRQFYLRPYFPFFTTA